MTAVLIVAVLVAVVVRESRIYRRNKAFSATAVQIVTPPGPRWWERALAKLAAFAVAVLLLVAALRFMPRSGSHPTAPAGDATGTTTPISSPVSPTRKGH